MPTPGRNPAQASGELGRCSSGGERGGYPTTPVTWAAGPGSMGNYSFVSSCEADAKNSPREVLGGQSGTSCSVCKFIFKLINLKDG